MPDSLLKEKDVNLLSLEDLKIVRAKLDERSQAHCLAKWYQVTLNLHNGRSASCCLQPSKPLPRGGVVADPSLLHNTKAHIQDRIDLRRGKKIQSCASCWTAEERGSFSERHFKSADSWAWEKLSDADGDARDIQPTYVEVSFSSQCQLRCSYCNPETSSSISKETPFSE